MKPSKPPRDWGSRTPANFPSSSPTGEGGKGDGVPSKTESIQDIYRLNYEVYKLIEKKVGHIRGDTGLDNVAFQLGVQYVLQVLRNDIVIDRQ